MKPTIGRIVHYRSRTGNYTVPAMITCTVDTLASKGVEVFERSIEDRRVILENFEPNANDVPELPPLQGVPPLADETHVHLAVFTPGFPGMRAGAQDFLVESGYPRSENVAGTYQEWDVPQFIPEADGTDEQPAGTWRWPERS